MKKSAFFLGIMAVLLLSSCGQEKEIVSEPTPIPAEEEIVEEVNSLSPACVKSTDELDGIWLMECVYMPFILKYHFIFLL